MKKYILGLILTCMVFGEIPACTTAVISGKYTVDGRPLLFKQRDTDELHNKLEFFTGGKYNFVGLVNSNDTTKAIWGGHNSAGFAIINSASYNLNVPDTCSKRDNEGVVMKLALQQCATLKDFEHLLETMPKPLGVNANFGVIDAQGGAAYYETGNFRYTKFDANDPSVAPMGYIIRTNFSFSGERSLDKGVSRFMAAQELFSQAALTHSLSYDFILHKVSRSLTHGLTKINLYDNTPQNSDNSIFVTFRDFIPRYITSASVLIHGVKGNEPTALTTMWTILGSPLSSVAIPVWITAGNRLPSILMADKTGNAKLCEWALSLKKQLFPIDRGEGHDYLNLAALITKDQKGILQKLAPVEAQIQLKAEECLKSWREGGINTQEMSDFYDWVNKYVSEYYAQTFDCE